MRSVFIIFVALNFLIASSCKQPPAANTSHLEWIDNYKDPQLDKIPDSLKYLVPVLNSVLRTDQQYRSVTDRSLYQKNFAKQQKLDKVNVAKVTAILDKHGWLGWQDVGLIGERAINMTMIHAPVPVKLKYYPMLVAAFKNRKVPGESLATYEDKLNSLLGRKQYYGTQVTIYKEKNVPFPIYEPEKVAGRRGLLKMVPLNNYLQLFQAEWDLEKYNALLPELIKDKKVSDTAPIHTDLEGIIRLQRMGLDSAARKP